NFRSDIFGGSCAVRRGDPVRTIGTKFRTTPARKDGKRMPRFSDRAAHRMTAAIEEMPRREWQAVQIVDGRTCQDSGRYFSRRDSHRRLLGFSLDDEVGMVLQQFGHVSCRRTEESDTHAVYSPGFVRPFNFVFVID